VRDLLKWASRLTHQSVTSSVHDLALEGYFVLGERSRNEMDKQFIKETIEKVTKVKIEERKYFEDYFNKNLAKQFAEIPQ
jgi:midasin (ATPase involved in ribosome maturation)